MITIKAGLKLGVVVVVFVLLSIGGCSNPINEGYFQFRKTTGSPIKIGPNITIKYGNVYEKVTSVNIISTEDQFEAQVGVEITGPGSNDNKNNPIELYTGPEYVGVFIDWNRDGNYGLEDGVAGVQIFRPMQISQTVAVNVKLWSTIKLSEISKWDVYVAVIYGEVPQFRNSPSYEFRYGDAKLVSQVELTPAKEGPLELLERTHAKLNEKLGTLSENTRGRKLVAHLVKQSTEVLRRGRYGVRVGARGRGLRRYITRYTKRLDEIKDALANKLSPYFTADEAARINGWIETQKSMLVGIPQISRITTDYHGARRHRHINVGFKRDLKVEMWGTADQVLSRDEFPDYVTPMLRNVRCEGPATAEVNTLENFG